MTVIQSTRRPITNVSPPTGSSISQNSSLFSEIHHLITNSPLVNNKLVDQLVTEAGPENDFEHDDLSMIDDTLTQLCSMINPSLSDASESSKLVLKVFLFNLNHARMFNLQLLHQAQPKLLFTIQFPITSIHIWRKVMNNSNKVSIKHHNCSNEIFF